MLDLCLFCGSKYVLGLHALLFELRIVKQILQSHQCMRWYERFVKTFEHLGHGPKSTKPPYFANVVLRLSEGGNV